METIGETPAVAKALTATVGLKALVAVPELHKVPDVQSKLVKGTVVYESKVETITDKG